MKKVFLLMVLLVSCFSLIQAQQQIVLHIEDYPEDMQLCYEDNQQVVVYAQNDCNEFMWSVNGSYYYENPLVINPWENHGYIIGYYSECGDFSHEFYVGYHGSNVPTSFIHGVFKRQYEINELEAVGQDSIDYPFNYEFLWSTGETTRTIEVTEPGTYTCTISEICGSATRTFIVKDNVEIDLATCDLETNLNMVTWQTTTAQAEYIDHVIIKRDGLEVGTANYSDGFFLDNIGSDLAQRTYTVIAVDTDGSQCPIVSYPKETIHMAYLTGVNNTIEVNWNIPTGYDLLGYNICEWIPNGKDGELNVIDFVGATVTSYTCQVSQFTSGYVIIQGVEAGKSESRLLSNRSSETVGIGEYGMDGFKVYPNPANGIFTVEGTGRLSVMNLLGQEIVDQEIEGKTTLELPQGIYFVKLNNATQKIVVE